MSALADLQSDFQSFLLGGNERMLGRITGTAKVSAETRLAVYYDAYRLRLLEALASNYPVLRAWIGEEEFENIGIAYVAAHPSRHFSIRWFGHLLPEFLAATPPWSDKPYIVEMAALEWALSEAFDAEDGTVIGIEDMAAIPAPAWPDMRLQFHPSAQRLDPRWNVPIIWKAINRNLDVEKNAASCRGETSATPSAGKEQREDAPAVADVPAPVEHEYPQAWLIWRQDLTVRFRTLDAAESRVVALSRYGSTFGQLCDALCAEADEAEAATRAAACLRDWVASGLIVAATVRE